MESHRSVSIVVFCLIVVGGSAAILGIAFLRNSPGQGVPRETTGSLDAVGSSSPLVFFGNNASTTSGWLMPANTLVITSFATTKSLNGAVETEISVFPYDIAPNATLYLGLYVDGQLSSNRTLDLTQNHAHPASMIGQPSELQGSEVANFTAALESYQVSIVPLTTSLPIGTILTVTAYVTSPIWVQQGTGSSISYEATATDPIPAAIPQDWLTSASSDLIAVPIRLTIGGDSDAS
jgi:hypothetical protein